MREQHIRPSRGWMQAAVPRNLARPADPQVCRIFVHAMSLQYCSAATRTTIAAALAAADTPIACIGFEWTEARYAVHLTLTTYPGGHVRHLATCHSYAHWIDWHGPTVAKA